jgi:methyl-accepting chemotaxis protein
VGVVYSLFAFLWNIVAAFANFFANVWNDPIGSIARLFADLADNVLGILETIAKGIDAVFGSNLAGAVAGWRSSLAGMVSETFGDGEEFAVTIDHMENFNKGYEVGAGFESKVGSFFGSGTGAYGLDGLMNSVSGMSNGIGDIAGSTGSIADSLDVTNEDLKYLKDLAEQEVINRFTTAEIRVEMGGVTNTVNQNVDLDGVVDYMVTGVQEAMERIAEGVHE